MIRFLVLILICSVPLWAFSQKTENSIKTVFIGKISNFTQWPAPVNQSDSFNIYVLNKPELVNILKKLERVKNKPVSVKSITSAEHISNAHILYIGDINKSELQKILNYPNLTNTLTISDSDGFAEEGVILNFYITPKGTMHFQININSLQQSEIQMDMNLIEIADVVR